MRRLLYFLLLNVLAWVPCVLRASIEIPALDPRFAWQGWQSPSTRLAILSTVLGDSDGDSLHSLHWGRHGPWRESGWRSGMEAVGGAAFSGKRNETGVYAGGDWRVDRRLWSGFGQVVSLGASAGWQFHTIGFPGGSWHNARLHLGLHWEPITGSGWAARAGYLHISNANISPGNEGVDGIFVGLGRRW